MSENRTHVNPALLRTELPNLSVEERAELLENIVRAFYDGSKFDYPSGGGLDGREGPERDHLANVLGAANDFHDYTRHAAVEQES